MIDTPVKTAVKRVSSAFMRSDVVPPGAAAGRIAPLDLIEEHLTDIYHPAEQSGRLIDGWRFPDDWVPPKDELVPVMKVQPFAAGGMEITVRMMDLEKIAHAIDGNKRFGKREAPEEVDQENVQKSADRAKRKVRLLVKNMGATNLVTLTRRETPDTGYWTPEQWAAAWDKLRRNLSRVIGDFPYVAVLEQHKKGNYHLHVAWVGKVNLNLIRGIWWACCGGRGAGNVDSQYIKVRSGISRADRVAKYISKYTTKHFEDCGRFNKKRYWASRQSLESARRYVLKADSLQSGLRVALASLGLRLDDFLRYDSVKGFIYDGIFSFPDGGGVWINYLPDVHTSDPPF